MLKFAFLLYCFGFANIHFFSIKQQKKQKNIQKYFYNVSYQAFTLINLCKLFFEHKKIKFAIICTRTRLQK